MADIVRLGDRRKRKARERETEAAAKRMMFGRTKGEKKRDDVQKSAAIRKLDGAKRDGDNEKKR
jgi:hypothetical protein